MLHQTGLKRTFQPNNYRLIKTNKKLQKLREHLVQFHNVEILWELISNFSDFDTLLRLFY
jgi:hypothetical protein